MNSACHQPDADADATRVADSMRPSSGDWMPQAESGFQPKPPPRIPDHDLIRLIGRGSYGDVWLARNVMGTHRAVKIVYRDRFDHDRPFEREFDGIRSFEPVSRAHDSQVDVLHIGRDAANGHFYYVMELADDAGATASAAAEQPQESIRPALRVPGLKPETYVPKTLRHVLQCRTRLSFDECLSLGRALAAALECLHQHGLIHRDIKPSNIIFVNDRPKLADIGLVTEADHTMSFVGTAGYMPPEGPGTPQGDLYSLGKVLYEACTGKDRQEFPELPSLVGASADDAQLVELNEILIRACHPDPRKRYVSAAQLILDLELLHAGRSVVSVRKLERRLRSATRTVGVAAIAIALMAAAYLFQRHQIRVAHRHLYFAHMNLAQRDWQEANMERLASLMNATESFPEKGFEWYFWQRQLHLDTLTLRGHTGAVNCVAYAPDGARIVTGGMDQTVRLWDAATGRQLALLAGHSGPVYAVAFAPDGRRIATGGYDATVRFWDASSGAPQGALIDLGGIVFGVAFSPNGEQIVVGWRAEWNTGIISVGLWDVASGTHLKRLEARAESPGRGAVAFSPDGSRVAAITEGRTAMIWDTASGREVSTLRASHALSALAFCADNQRLVTGGGQALVWDVVSGEVGLELQADQHWGLGGVAASPLGSTVATGGGDQRLFLWDAATGKELFRLPGHRGSIQAMAYSPDGNFIATASEDGTAKIWSAHAPANPQTFAVRPHPASVRTIAPDQPPSPIRYAINMLAFSPDGKRVAVTVADRTVRILDAASGREQLVLSGQSDEVIRISWSPDGRRIATGNGWHARQSRDRARIWDTTSGRELLALEGYGFVAFSPDGDRIATASAANGAAIWDAATGEALVRLRGHTEWIHSGVFSPDGRRFATSGGDLTVRIWDAASGRQRLAFKRGWETNNYSVLAYSPDGRRLVTANFDRTPKVWDAESGRALFALEGHSAMVRCVTYSPDGKRILSSGTDRTAKVWDAASGRELLTLRGGHFQSIAATDFAPDGSRIATADWAGVIKVWEAATEQQVRAWKRDEASNTRIARGR